MEKTLPSTPVVENIPMTESELAFMNSQSKVVFEAFNERTKSYKPSGISELPPNFREILNEALTNIPYSELKAQNVSYETYKEMCCTSDMSKMEWGVMLKCCSLILATKPDDFSINQDFQKIITCKHTDEKALKICSLCDGRGNIGERLSTSTISIRNYCETIVAPCQQMMDTISLEIKAIKDEIVQTTWNEMKDKDRFDIKNAMAKASGVKQPQSPIIKPIQGIVR